MEHLRHRQELKHKDTEIDKIRFHEIKTSKSMMLFLYIKLLFIKSHLSILLKILLFLDIIAHKTRNSNK